MYDFGILSLSLQTITQGVLFLQVNKVFSGETEVSPLSFYLWQVSSERHNQLEISMITSGISIVLCSDIFFLPLHRINLLLL